MPDTWKLRIQLAMPVALAALLGVIFYILYSHYHSNVRHWRVQHQKLSAKIEKLTRQYNKAQKARAKQRRLNKVSNQLTQKRQRYKQGLQQLTNIVDMLPQRVALSRVIFDQSGLHYQLQAAVLQSIQAMRQKLAKQSDHCQWTQMVRRSEQSGGQMVTAHLKCEI